MYIRNYGRTLVAPFFVGMCFGACGGDTGAADVGLDLVSPQDIPVDVVEVEPDIAAFADSADSGSDVQIIEQPCSAGSPLACRYQSRDKSSDERGDLSVTEPVTGRELPILARIPVGGPDPSPVVIWSHGGAFFEGGERQSKEWGLLFASQGFVVLHIGHSELGAEVDAVCTAAAMPANECADAKAGDDENGGLVTVARSYDIVAVLDALPRLAGLITAAGGPALDLEKVVVAGWSGGSRGPMVVMGATLRPSPSAPIFANAHALPAAAMFLSPSGPGFGGFFLIAEETSWEAMRGPTFMATGANDVKPSSPELDGPTRRIPFAAQPGDGKRFMLFSSLAVGVGGHGSYNLGDTEGDPRLVRLESAIQSAARAFLDAVLRDDSTAKTWLSSNAARILASEAEWLKR